LVIVCSCPLPSLSLPAVQRSLMIVSPAAGRRRISLLLYRRRPDVFVVVVVVAGGGAGLSAGTKPWRRTCWSSSASSRCRRLGSEARWRPDEALRHAAHPAMQVVRPPAAAGQLRRPSSSPWSASVKDTDEDDDRRVVASSRRRCHCRWYSQPLLPQSLLPPSSRQPLLFPPTPPLQPSVDGWLLCCLLRRLPPNLSSTAFVIV
jgi:hypothetical protein